MKFVHLIFMLFMVVITSVFLAFLLTERSALIVVHHKHEHVFKHDPQGEDIKALTQMVKDSLQQNPENLEEAISQALMYHEKKGHEDNEEEEIQEILKSKEQFKTANQVDQPQQKNQKEEVKHQASPSHTPSKSPAHSSPSPSPKLNVAPQILGTTIKDSMCKNNKYSTVLKHTETQQYNGLVLPKEWPPNWKSPPRRGHPMWVDRTTNTFDKGVQLTLPIPIYIGRQLFVDDFLIDTYQSKFKRTFHEATVRSKKVVTPEMNPGTTIHHATLAVGGVWWAVGENVYKMVYQCHPNKLCYAETENYAKWDVNGNDEEDLVIQSFDKPIGSANFVVDWDETDHTKRFKLFVTLADPEATQAGKIMIFYSRDGKTWSTGTPWCDCWEECTVYQNPFRGSWSVSIKQSLCSENLARRYWETDKLGGTCYKSFWDERRMVCKNWYYDQPVYWLTCDKEDVRNEEILPGIMSAHAIAYESLMIGLFGVHYAEKDEPFNALDKSVHIQAGFSRDGFAFDRSHKPLIHEDADMFYLVPGGGGFLVEKNELIFFFGARKKNNDQYSTFIGEAVLRRDGFASVEPPSSGEGVIVTKVLTYCGNYMFINMIGDVVIEILPEKTDSVVLLRSKPLSGDSTSKKVVWEDGSLSLFEGYNVRFRFNMKSGSSIFSFWISAEEEGPSYGFVAAGGKDFHGPRDTVGVANIGHLHG